MISFFRIFWIRNLLKRELLVTFSRVFTYYFTLAGCISIMKEDICLTLRTENDSSQVFGHTSITIAVVGVVSSKYSVTCNCNIQ